MRAVAWDSETELIQAGLLAPPLVCVSWAQRRQDQGRYDLDNDPSGLDTGLLLDRPGLAWLRARLLDPEILLIGANLPYDFGVAANEDPELLPLIFDAYRAGRIWCVQTQQRLIDIAMGMRKWRRKPNGGKVSRASYGLDDLVEWYFDTILDKGDDTWRLRYALLKGIDPSRWPVAARTYAINDSIAALDIFDEQKEYTVDGQPLPNRVEQQRAAWVLHLMSMWGIRAEEGRVDYFIQHCDHEIAKMQEALKETGIFKKDGSRIMAEIMRRVKESYERQQLDVPFTPTGRVATDKETLQNTDDPNLHVLAESMTFVKHKGQWGPVLRAATKRPVCCRYEVLVETGRTASSGSEGQEGTNIQNPPRKGDVRPAIIPRPGWVFCSTDADTIELRAHAQNCLDLVGWSRMADHLIEQAKSKGPDLHEVLGAAIMGVDPRVMQAGRKGGDKEMTDARQFAKIPNFGFPGGLGAETFVSYAAAQLDRAAFIKWFDSDREVSVGKAKVHRQTWFDTFPENKNYFEIVASMIDDETGRGIVRQLMSGRIRGGVRFTAAANGFFQGRVADAMKDVLFRLAEECYTGRETRPDGSLTGRRSILWGSRPVMFLHDEPIVEHPEDGTETLRAERQRTIVVECLSRWLPDIPCTSTAVLMRRWQKGAEPLWLLDNGEVVSKPAEGKVCKLIPVKPEKFIKEGKEKIKWVADNEDMRWAA